MPRDKLCNWLYDKSLTKKDCTMSGLYVDWNTRRHLYISIKQNILQIIFLKFFFFCFFFKGFVNYFDQLRVSDIGKQCWWQDSLTRWREWIRQQLEKQEKEEAKLRTIDGYFNKGLGMFIKETIKFIGLEIYKWEGFYFLATSSLLPKASLSWQRTNPTFVSWTVTCKLENLPSW